MSETDWDTVTVLRKPKARAAEGRSKQNIESARRQGLEIDTEKKYRGGGNAQHSIHKNTAALDRETEELKHETVDMNVGKLIQKGRMEKGLTQKALATAINEKPGVVNEYESGKAIPNNQILGKLERAVGIKLRGKDKGKPLGERTKKK
eukprot:Nk52_evm32s1705 gene=Nk52_evmTU32s1705